MHILQGLSKRLLRLREVEVRVFQYYLKRAAIVIALSVALPSIAWADFFNYARYLQLEIAPEVQLIKDAYLHTNKPTQSSIRALNKLLTLNSNSKSNNAFLYAQATLYLANLHFNKGRYTKAEALLVELQKTVQDLGNEKLQLFYFYQFGMVSFSKRKNAAARALYISARELSLRLKNPLMLALSRQALGEVQLMSGDTNSALNNFKLAYTGLRNLDYVILAADAGILYLALNSKRKNPDYSEINIPELLNLVRLTPDKSKRLQQISELLDTYNSLGPDTLPPEINIEFHRLAEESLQLVNARDSGKSEFSVTRNLANLYEKKGNYVAALRLVQDALSANQDGAANIESIPLYLQKAKLLKLMNRGVEAISAYHKTLQLLKPIVLHNNRARVDGVVDSLIEVYDELIALLFVKQHSVTEELAIQDILTELRNYIEEKHYFYFNTLLNESYANFLTSKIGLTVKPKKSAIIYPTVFDDRLEILVSLPNGLKSYSSKVSKKRFMQEITTLRKSIQQPDKKSAYKDSAMSLYRWLISPLKQQLLRQNVSSLVFVLSDVLASLPTSVLFDKKGRRYLVEQYAIAVSPGLMLTDASVRRRKRGTVLFFGATTAQAPALLNQEIKKISATTSVSTHLDKSFSEKNINQIMLANDFNKLHISVPLAIEPQFINSYLEANGSMVSLASMLDALKKKNYRDSRKSQLELIVLSGSKSVSQNINFDGGILAIAHKLGSRNVVASMWPQISEETPIFMSEFYTILSSSSMTVATAIRRAKMRLIASKNYQHPAYWARFELFGNWL